ncbi:MAG: TIGR01777 family oxidoreductase [Polyangiaceae bacterium]
MKTILITGGSGFLGRRISEELIGRGDRVTVLSRDAAKTRGKVPPGVRTAGWTPTREGPWYDEVENVDAVVHLAGEVVAQRWTEQKRKEIVESRVGSTDRLVEAIGRAKHRPKVLVSASAIGFYGAHDPGETLDENSPRGSGFLAELVEKWEASAKKAEEHGVRVVNLRIGVVFGKGGGALEKMLPAFRFFVGGPIGSGDQFYSWVHIDDIAGLAIEAIDDERYAGPINATSPYPATAGEVAKTIGATLNRPSFFKVPKAIVSVLMGEAAEVVTESQRVLPKRAIELGYEFRYARLQPALEQILRS